MSDKRNWHETEIGGAIIDGRYGFSALKLDPSINHEIRVIVDGNDVGYYNQDDLLEALHQASDDQARVRRLSAHHATAEEAADCTVCSPSSLPGRIEEDT